MNLLQKSTERIFRIPFLFLLQQKGKLTTTDIIKDLREYFSPIGHDAQLAKNRADDYFSQKVRNVKSHESIKQYAKYSRSNGWEINETGLKFLDEKKEVVDEIVSIMKNTFFSYYDKITAIDLIVLPFFPRRKVKNTTTTKKPIKKYVFYDENVEEGKTVQKTVQLRERSQKLRDAAIKHFTVNGEIKCSICQFEFAKTFGEYGNGYIEIHHKKPIYEYEENGINAVLSSAIDNLAPVCANCHRMLHHKKGITFEEVLEIYKENNSND